LNKGSEQREKEKSFTDSINTDSTLSVESSKDSTEKKSELYTQTEKDSVFSLHDSAWVNMKRLIPDLSMDIRYASTNNFMQIKIYPCGECFLRKSVAKALFAVQKQLKEQNLGIRVFDCYRPQSAQKKLWQKNPDPRFVTPPQKGSMHSRGSAVDLTLTDLNTGKPLDMGTEFDYFGYEAYWSYKGLGKEIHDNRQLLLKTMEAQGFKTITTEWWHFSYRRGWYALSDMQWVCE
jgi:zinc D-Ala-D-Ala dipeptidase